MCISGLCESKFYHSGPFDTMFTSTIRLLSQDLENSVEQRQKQRECKTIVIIKIYTEPHSNSIFFIQAIIFTSEGRVKKNGQKVTLPYNSGISETKIVVDHFIPNMIFWFLFFCWLTGDISIFHASSFHIMLQTSFGLQIQIQHVPLMQVYVSLEQSYREKTHGRFYISH